MRKIKRLDAAQVWRNEAGARHRLDGPAYIGDDGSAWWVDGRLHRLDGPAVIWTSGQKDEWFIDGKEIILKHLLDWIDQMNIEPDYTKWTDKEKMWFKLRFSGN